MPHVGQHGNLLLLFFLLLSCECNYRKNDVHRHSGSERDKLHLTKVTKIIVL